MAKNENTKLIEFIQAEYVKAKLKGDIPTIAPDTLMSYKIETTKDKIEIRNLVLKKSFFFSNNYSIGIIDHKKDFDGILITEKNDLYDKLKKVIKQGVGKISYSELLKLKIDTKVLSLKIGNIKLSAGAISNDYYVSIANSQQDEEGRTLPKYVDAKLIKKALAEYKLTKQMYRKHAEPKLNELIREHLAKHFSQVQNQKNNKKGTYDIDIGDNDFVIEIKMASSIKSSKHEASGQIRHYLKGFDPKKFMLLIIGEKSEEDKPNIISLIYECKKDFKCHVDYMYAV